jgi:hypothetical protein
VDRTEPLPGILVAASGTVGNVECRLQKTIGAERIALPVVNNEGTGARSVDRRLTTPNCVPDLRRAVDLTPGGHLNMEQRWSGISDFVAGNTRCGGMPVVPLVCVCVCLGVQWLRAPAAQGAGLETYEAEATSNSQGYFLHRSSCGTMAQSHWCRTS